MALAVLLIAQRLQVGIELFALFLRQLRADARQLLAVVSGELGQIQLVDQRFQTRGFRLQAEILRLRQRRIAGLRADAAFNFVKLAAGVGLLLRQLVERVGNFPRPILLLLRLAAGFQKLAADLQDLLIQRVGGEGGRYLVRRFADIR